MSDHVSAQSIGWGGSVPASGFFDTVPWSALTKRRWPFLQAAVLLLRYLGSPGRQLGQNDGSSAGRASCARKASAVAHKLRDNTLWMRGHGREKPIEQISRRLVGLFF